MACSTRSVLIPSLIRPWIPSSSSMESRWLPEKKFALHLDGTVIDFYEGPMGRGFTNRKPQLSERRRMPRLWWALSPVGETLTGGEVFPTIPRPRKFPKSRVLLPKNLSVWKGRRGFGLGENSRLESPVPGLVHLMVLHRVPPCRKIGVVCHQDDLPPVEQIR